MSNEASIWWPFHTKDIRSETCNMSKVAKCCYIELLDLLWERDGSLPAEDGWLCCELGMARKAWATIRDRVLGQFTITSGRITHPRITKELEKAKSHIEQKRRAGRASAEARKGNGSSTEDQRAFNGRSTGVATGDPTGEQPRAGGGVGVGASSHTQEEGFSSGSHTHAHTRGNFTVIGGGAK